MLGFARNMKQPTPQWICIMNRKEFLQIYTSEFTARFCTWAVLSQLLVHLMHIHWKTSSEQLSIIGISISMLYLSAICGGIIKDYLSDGWVGVVTGIVLIGVGTALLNLKALFFYAGLSAVLLGAGIVTPNTPLLLSSLSSDNRDQSFTVLYAVTNAGIILGSILSGFVQSYFSWRGVILLNESMIAIWLVSCFSKKWLYAFKETTKKKILAFFVALFLFQVVSYFYLSIQSVSEILLTIAGIIYVGFILYLIYRNKQSANKLIYMLFLTMIAVIFFSGEFQVASTLVDYSVHFVSLRVDHIKIPAGSLLAFESVFVIIGAFFISKIKWFSALKQTEVKAGVGLLFGAFAFSVLYLSHFFAASHSISVIWIIFAFLLLGFGDVSLMPPIMSYIADNAPSKYKGRLMAGVYFSISLSGYFSGLIGSALSSSFSNANSNLHFYTAGFQIMIFGLGAVAFLILFIGLARKFFSLKTLQ